MAEVRRGVPSTERPTGIDQGAPGEALLPGQRVCHHRENIVSRSTCFVVHEPRVLVARGPLRCRRYVFTQDDETRSRDETAELKPSP